MMTGSQAHEQSDLKIKRRLWTQEEDQKLIEYMKRRNGPTNWSDVPKLTGLNRCRKSCHLRWHKYLRPGIKRGNFSQDEVATIISLQKEHPNQWAFISTHLSGRTSHEIKNYYNTHLKKKFNTPLGTQSNKKKFLAKQTPSGVTQSQILAAANFLVSTADYVRACALGFHSDANAAQPTNLNFLPNTLQGFDYVSPNSQAQLHGLGFNLTDAAQTLPNTLHPQGPSLNFQAMKDPTVNNYYPNQFCPSIDNMPDVLDSLFGNVPNAGSIPASMVSASPERSMINQVQNEITPPAEESSNPLSTSTTFWLELLMDNETTDSFCGDISLE